MAQELGYANPDAMLSEMEYKHVVEWSEYFEYVAEQNKPDRHDAIRRR